MFLGLNDKNKQYVKYFCKRNPEVVVYRFRSVEFTRKVMHGLIKRNRLSTESFKTLVVQYSRQVMNTASRVLGDRQAAQDVHQEVFMAIWRRWAKFNGQMNWQAYLYRTTVRKAMEYVKKERSFSIEDGQIKPTAVGEKPDSNLRALELQQKLSAQLSKLPDRQAEVFVLSRIEGLTSEEIGKILGCSHETVRVHLHRAMKRLAVELSDYLVK